MSKDKKSEVLNLSVEIVQIIAQALYDNRRGGRQDFESVDDTIKAVFSQERFKSEVYSWIADLPYDAIYDDAEGEDAE